MLAIDHVRFSCQQCGECCRWPGVMYVYPSDVKRVSLRLGITPKQFVDRFTDHYIERYYFADMSMEIARLRLKRNDYACIFLNGDKCVINEAKPFLCKHAPFTQSIIGRQSFWGLFTERCPGVGKGKMYEARVIQELLRKEQNIENRYLHIAKLCENDLSAMMGFKMPTPQLFQQTFHQTYAEYLEENDVGSNTIDKILTQ